MITTKKSILVDESFPYCHQVPSFHYLFVDWELVHQVHSYAYAFNYKIIKTRHFINKFSLNIPYLVVVEDYLKTFDDALVLAVVVVVAVVDDEDFFVHLYLHLLRVYILF